MKTTSIRDRGLIRLISATHHKAPILRALVDDDEEADLLAEVESWTNARLEAEKHGTPSLDKRELAYARRSADMKLYGQTHINAAFAYTRPTGNRFNGGDRGAWYCSYDLHTSADEVGFHRTRELAYIGVYEDDARYVEILADFIGEFPDLDGEPRPPALHPDPARGYPEGQRLALSLRRNGEKGLLYPSVRRKGGRCFVAFDPGIIQNVRPGATWRLVWNGSPHFHVHGV